MMIIGNLVTKCCQCVMTQVTYHLQYGPEALYQIDEEQPDVLPVPEVRCADHDGRKGVY